jgi:DNA (cytosine-5)-methyltransferase 1
VDSIRWGWLDRACVDLEAEGYACAAAVLPASLVGAEHQRKRLFFVADSDSSGRERHQPLECVPVSASASRALYGDPLDGARRALAGDYGDLQPCDGLSVVMERRALRGYGNAIVPQVAAEFIGAVVSAAYPAAQEGK